MHVIISVRKSGIPIPQSRARTVCVTKKPNTLASRTNRERLTVTIPLPTWMAHTERLTQTVLTSQLTARDSEKRCVVSRGSSAISSRYQWTWVVRWTFDRRTRRPKLQQLIVGGAGHTQHLSSIRLLVSPVDSQWKCTIIYSIRVITPLNNGSACLSLDTVACHRLCQWWALEHISLGLKA